MIALLKRLFCVHAWTTLQNFRGAVTRVDGSVEGHVTLALFKCSHCGKEWLMVSDRTHL